MFTMFFVPWQRLRAVKDNEAIRFWLTGVVKAAKDKFRAGSLGPHSGRMYRRRGRPPHRASAANEYPAKDTGRLLKSAGTRVTSTEGEFGLNEHYAKYLVTGTRRMASRKMAWDALDDGIKSTPAIGSFARFKR